jgi:hypothetical protein
MLTVFVGRQIAQRFMRSLFVVFDRPSVRGLADIFQSRVSAASLVISFEIAKNIQCELFLSNRSCAVTAIA